jgi:hypothetical protein
MSRACLVKRRRPKKQIHGAQILQPKLSPLERHDPSSDICQSVHSISICLSCTIPLLHHRVSLLEAALSTHPNLQHVRSVRANRLIYEGIRKPYSSRRG